jgi:hypothetical protein
MDKCAVRRAILSIVADAAPAPCNCARLAEGLALRLAVRLETAALAAECRELESRGYLANLKHALDPVYKGVTGAARDQLDMAGKLDPALWGDAAL